MKDNKDFINYEYNEVEDSSWIRSASEKDTDTPYKTAQKTSDAQQKTKTPDLSIFRKIQIKIKNSFVNLLSQRKHKNQSVSKTHAQNNKKKILIFIIIFGAFFLNIIVPISLVYNALIIKLDDTFFSRSGYTVSMENKSIGSRDIAKIKKFKNLHTLKFINCTLEADELCAIATNGELRELVIQNCDLTDTQLNSINFEALEDLYILDLSYNNKLTNLKPISPLADSLEVLNIDNTSPKSLKLIETFTKIKNLSMNHVGISDIDFVSNMPYLQVFSADRNDIISLNGLKNAAILETVSLNNNLISDISILAKSSNTLKQVYLDDNSISDFFALANCTSITHFSANYNQLTSTEWLAEWTKLSSLSLSNNKIKNFNINVPNNTLKEIDLSNNNLTKIENIVSETGGYVSANFSNNSITSINLPKNCYYDTLALHGNPLKDITFLKNTEGYKISFDFSNELDPQILKDMTFFRIYIVDCPTNHIVEIERASYSVTITTSDEIDNLISK